MNFKTYLNKINDQYDFIKKHSKPLNSVCGFYIEDLTFLPYNVIKKDIPEHFKNQEFEKVIFLILYNIDKKIKFTKVKKEKNNIKLLFIFWVREQYEKINKLEETHLYNPPDSKLLQAGIKDLDILGDINTIDSLANGNVLDWHKIGLLPYSTIFNKLLKNTIEARINKNLIEINKQK